MTEHKKNLDIEGLRAYAIAITIAAHIYILAPAQLMWAQTFWLGGGVDLFFCISGYLITTSLLKRYRGDHFGGYLKGFLVRRFTRLMPAALACSSLTLVVSQSFDLENVMGPRDAVFHAWLWGTLNVENFFIWLYPTPASVLRHYWSLSLEEQFYLVLAVVLFFTKNRKLLVVPVFLLAVLQTTKIRPWGTLLWFTRSDALLYGAFFALILNYHAASISTAMRRIPKPLLGGIFFLLLPMPVILSQPALSEYYMGFVAASASVLVGLAIVGGGGLIPAGKTRNVVAYIGSRSYSIYLFHDPIIALFRSWVLENKSFDPTQIYQLITLLVVVIAVTLGVAEVSYRCIETPLREMGQRWSRTIDSKRLQKTQINPALP